MAIGFLNSNEGEYTTWVRWGAKACQWEMGTENGKTSCNLTQAIFDIENLKVGWASIQVGQAPQWVFAPNLETPVARPAGIKVNDRGQDVPLFTNGFSVKVFSRTSFGDDNVREFATNQKGSLAAINELHTQYEEQKSTNVGKVPVVEFSGHNYIDNSGKGFGTNVPKLNIIKWVDRPAELIGDGVVTNSPAPQSTLQAAPVQAAQFAASSASEF